MKRPILILSLLFATYCRLFSMPSEDTVSIQNWKFMKGEVENGQSVELDDGSRITYEYLINTSPLNEFLTYFEGDEFRNLRDSLSYNRVLVFNLGFDKKSKFTKEHWFYIPDKTVNFYRIGFYDNILDSDKLSMYIEIGYNKDDVIDTDRPRIAKPTRRRHIFRIYGTSLLFIP